LERLSLAAPGRIDFDKLAAGHFEKHFRRAAAAAAAPDQTRVVMDYRRSGISGPRVLKMRADQPRHEIGSDRTLRGCAQPDAPEAAKLAAHGAAPVMTCNEGANSGSIFA
jgi:hypothetical protein